MPIIYEKLDKLLKDNGKTFYSLRKDKIVGTETIRKLQNHTGHVDTRTFERICEYLNCQPGDIMEYVEDTEEETE